MPAGDAVALKEKIEWVIANKEMHQKVGKKARETYEKYFTMDVFGYNLENAIEETVDIFGGKNL